MASQAASTKAEILALDLSAQGFVPVAEERRAHTFLSLAPTTSASYPSTPLVKNQVQNPGNTQTRTLQPVVAPAVPNPAVINEALKTRRSSSLGSEASAKRRFLKLGPVHYGEHQGGEAGDWSEDVLAE